MPYSRCITLIAPLLGEFHVQPPDIQLEMHLGNEKLDLIGGEADLALRVGALPDSNLVARKLGSLRTRVFASPSYIERYADRCIRTSCNFIARWRCKNRNVHNNRFFWSLSDCSDVRDFPVNPLMVANDPAALNGAVLCGEGLLLTGDVMAKPFVQSGLVRRVLAGWTGPEVDVNAVFPGGRLVSPKVRAFVGFLVTRMNFYTDDMMPQCPARLAAQKADNDAKVEVGTEAKLRAEGKRILENVTA
ncbi:substrate binding domain-containing protein [Xanthomonas populi]|uniref:substrate binding domain-containing protein n=1 Tax=Xanthomonas populi TaxID=53414 RepID=UPI001304B5C9|nr:substrate binding domain-containing protein [Xanthomonas populi]